MVTPGRMGTLPLALLGLLTMMPRILSEAFSIEIDAQEEECFFEQGMTGAKMVLRFEVTQGGFLDIDVDITDPEDEPIFHLVRATSGKCSFVAYQDGSYKFCFSNRMSSLTPKVVMFTVDTSRAPRAGLGEAQEDGPPTTQEKMIKQLAETILAVKHEQQHLEVPEKIHQAMNEKTLCKVVLCSFFLAAALLAMAIAQIHYLMNFFPRADNRHDLTVEGTTQEAPEGRKSLLSF